MSKEMPEWLKIEFQNLINEHKFEDNYTLAEECFQKSWELMTDRQKLKPIESCPETDEFILLEYDKSDECISMVEVHNRDSVRSENIKNGNNFEYYFLPLPTLEGE